MSTSDQAILYVVAEWPARTQTFVATEVAEVSSAVPVYLYALRGPRGLPVWVRLGADQAGRGTPRLWAVANLARLVRALPATLRGLRPIGGASDWGRIALAVVHSAHLALRLGGCRPPTHVHAHFFGRASQVAVLAHTALPGADTVSRTVTGHAGDVLNPQNSGHLARLVAGTDVVVCASKFVESAVHRLDPRARTAVVRCGVRVPHERRVADVRPPLRLVTVARLVDKKGVDTCLDAAAVLRARGLPFSWTFLGDGPLRVSLEEAAHRLGVAENVTWLGHVDNARVLEILDREADVFVLACRRAGDGDLDGIPVALMEAMVRDVPVVTTAIGGIPELVADGSTGLVVEPQDPESLAAAITRIVDDADLRETVSRAGRRRVEEAFDVRREGRRLVELFTRLRGERRPGAGTGQD
jgi:colanic acid/amylovoran biosynthesis glycosyltransferase